MNTNKTQALFNVERRLLFIAIILIVLAGFFFLLGSMTGKNYVGQAAGEAGLIAWYAFEEGSGSAVADSSGNGLDGVHYHDTEVVTDAAWVTGYTGQGIQFGSSYVVVPDNSLLDTNTFSIEAYIKGDSYSSTDTIVKKDGQYILRFHSDGCLKGYIWESTGTNLLESSICGLNTGQWYRVAFTYDGSMARFYLDDVLTDELPLSVSIPSNTKALTVGGSSFNTESFDGVLDEVKLYNYAKAYPETPESPVIVEMIPEPGYQHFRRNINISCAAQTQTDSLTSMELAMPSLFSPNPTQPCSGTFCRAVFDVPGYLGVLLDPGNYSFQCIANTADATTESDVRTFEVLPFFALPEDYSEPTSVIPGSGANTVSWMLEKQGDPYVNSRDLNTLQWMVKLKSPHPVDTPDLYELQYNSPGATAVVLTADDLIVYRGGPDNQDVFLEWMTYYLSSWSSLEIDILAPFYVGGTEEWANATHYQKFFNISSTFDWKNVVVTETVDTSYTNWRVYQSPSTPSFTDRTTAYGLSYDEATESVSFTYDAEEGVTYSFIIQGELPGTHSLITSYNDPVVEGEDLVISAQVRDADNQPTTTGIACSYSSTEGNGPLSYDSSAQAYQETFSGLPAGDYNFQITCTVEGETPVSQVLSTTVEAIQNPVYALTVATPAGQSTDTPVEFTAVLTDQDTLDTVDSETCTLYIDEDGTTKDMPYETDGYKATHQFATAGEKFYTVECTMGTDLITFDGSVSIVETTVAYLLDVWSEENKRVDEDVIFTANMTTRQGIPVPDAACVLSTDGAAIDMAYAAALYTGTHAYTESGSKPYAVNCSKDGESVNRSSTLTIYDAQAAYGLAIEADEDKREDETVFFRARLYDLATGAAFPNGQCFLTVDEETILMTYSDSRYRAAHTFDGNGDYPYAVWCQAEEQNLTRDSSVYIRSSTTGSSPLLLKGSPLLLKGGTTYDPPEPEDQTPTKKLATFTYDDNITKVELEFNLEYGDSIILDLFKLTNNPYDDPEGVLHSLYKLNASYPVNYVILSYRVPLAWIDEQGLANENVKMKRYDDGWIKLPTYYEGDDGDYATYTSYSSDLGLFAILGVTDALESSTAEEEDDILRQRRDIDPVAPPEEEQPSGFKALFEKINVPSWVWYAIGGVLVVAVLVLFGLSILRNLPHKEQEIDPQALEQIREYYLECYNQGLSPEQIYDNLVNVGWDKRVLDQIFNRDF